MTLLSLFSGIGAFEKALENLKIDYDLVGFSEIDKYATKSYCEIHNINPDLNLGDITKIDETKLPLNIDLLTYGFPCQDISVAGKLKGFVDEDGKVTRSGLFFEALRIIEKIKPKIAIAENVKNLTSRRFKSNFETVLTSLEIAGYNNYWKVLNAKDYGIPQNRERVFIVSIRKDVDTYKFEFPKPIELQLRLKDLIEDEVEEKYYIKTDKANELLKMLIANGQLNAEIQTCDGTINEPKIKEISNCITARYDSGISKRKSVGTCVVKQVGNIVEEKNFNNPQRGRVYNPNGLSPTLNTVSGGGLEPKIVIIDDTQCFDGTRYYGKYSPALRANRHGLKTLTGTYKIRKLTPKECWRLMGFFDEDFEKAEKVNSNTQLYKQAGNSIVVNVLEILLKQIFKILDEEV